jgi:hypothetical protein
LPEPQLPVSRHLRVPGPRDPVRPRSDGRC